MKGVILALLGTKAETKKSFDLWESKGMEVGFTTRKKKEYEIVNAVKAIGCMQLDFLKFCILPKGAISLRMLKNSSEPIDRL